MQNQANAEGIKKTADALTNPKDADEARAAKHSLVSLINESTGQNFLKDDSPNEKIFAAAHELRDANLTIGRSYLKEDPEAVITQAKTDSLDKLADRFLEMEPYETGNAEHDVILGLHKMYRTYHNEIEAVREDKSPDAQEDFMNRMSGRIASDVLANLRANYQAGGDDDGDARDLEGSFARLAKIAVGNFKEMGLTGALAYVTVMAKQIKQAAATKLGGANADENKTKRAAYAEAQFRKGAQIARETYDEDNGKGNALFEHTAREIYEATK